MPDSQLSILPLRGGKRRGAGRKAGPNRRVRHLSRPSITRHVAGHVTLKLREDLPSLRRGRMVRVLEGSFRRGAERDDFRLVHYSIQSDHVHAIVEAADRDALGRGMMSLATRIAGAVNHVFGRSGRVFRDRYHLRLLRTPREVRRALAYVLLNARKHLGRLAPKLGTIDPASSGAWFDGWRHGREPCVERPPPVASARSWLVRIGWRRHGLLDPSEVPGLTAAH